VEVEAVQSAALRGVEDVWTRRAAAIAIGQEAADLAVRLLADPRWSQRAATEGETELLREITGLAAARMSDFRAAALLEGILALSDHAVARQLQRVLLRALAEPLARRGQTLRGLAQRLPDASLRDRIELVFAAADTAVSNSAAAPEERRAAIQLLSFDPQYSDTLSSAALGGDPAAGLTQELRLQAVAALSRSAGPEVWRRLLATWPRQSAPFRRALLDALLTRIERTELLLDEIASGTVRAGELETGYVNRLLKQGRGEIRQRAEQLLASAIPADRQQVLADYQHVLRLDGDPRRGRELFAKNCAGCHRIGDLGVNVAPDISDSRVKRPEQLLTDILQPNRAIDNNYLSYTVATTDGQVLTGVIAAETGTSVTLRQQEGKEVTLSRSQIEELRSNGISLMPDGLEKSIPPQEMADIISFIKNWRYLDGRTPLGK
jgi:putative heme-binding domain-containing protein